MIAVSRMFKYALVFLGCAFLLGLIFHRLLVRVVMTQFLEANLGVSVQIQRVVPSFSKTQVWLENVHVQNPEGFSEGPLAKISSIFMDFDLSSLRDRRITIKKLEVDCKEVHILRNSDGDFNWFFLRPFQNDNGETPQGDVTGSEEWIVQVDQFFLTLGRANYIDFSGSVPFKRSFSLKLQEEQYVGVQTTLDIIKIIAWETLIVMEQNQLEEAFELISKKIESKLGTKRDYLKTWRGQDIEAMLTEETADLQSETPL